MRHRIRDLVRLLDQSSGGGGGGGGGVAGGSVLLELDVEGPAPLGDPSTEPMYNGPILASDGITIAETTLCVVASGGWADYHGVGQRPRLGVTLHPDGDETVDVFANEPGLRQADLLSATDKCYWLIQGNRSTAALAPIVLVPGDYALCLRGAYGTDGPTDVHEAKAWIVELS
jgi:hypothetical protein